MTMKIESLLDDCPCPDNEVCMSVIINCCGVSALFGLVTRVSKHHKAVNNSRGEAAWSGVRRSSTFPRKGPMKSSITCT